MVPKAGSCLPVRQPGLLSSRLAILVLTLALYAGMLAAQDPAKAGADLPEAPEKAKVVEICGNCHGVDRFADLRKSKSDWDFIINKMSDEGLRLTDQEYEIIIGYLPKFLGPDSPVRKINVNKAQPKELADRLEITAKEADAIVDYRKRHGAFRNWREVAGIDQVDAKKIEAKKDLIEF